MSNGDGEVTADAVYSELYEEGRYFRGHELTVSTWYGVILLGILTVIVTIKSALPQSPIYYSFSNSLPIKLIIFIIVITIGINAILSVIYSGIRYSDIRNHLDKMEPANKDFKKTDVPYNPRQLICVTLLILTIVTSIAIFIS
jgi:hypothetical protein